MATKDSCWDPKMSTELVEHILLFKLFDKMIKDELPDYSSSAEVFKINPGDMESLMAFDLSADFEAPSLPKNNPLIEIIFKHTRIVKFKKGDVIIKEGDYGNSAFFIASGKVGVILPPGIPEHQMGHVSDQKMGLLKTVKKIWQQPSYPEERVSQENNSTVSAKEKPLRFANVNEICNRYEHAELNSADMFGEVGALGRTARTTTIIAKTYCELLEIRWQGLRDLRHLSADFRKSIDDLYQKNSLLVHLLSLPLFVSLSKKEIREIAEDASFRTYGSFEWQAEYKNNLENNGPNSQKSEPLIVAEGDHSDNIYLVCSGFARVSYQYNNGYQVLKYLGKGDVFGLEAVIYNWKNNSRQYLKASLHALGYADIIQIPGNIIERKILSRMNSDEIDTYLASDLLQTFEKQEKNSPVKELDLNDAVLDFMSDHHFINGSSTMLIDTDRCTRCDDCVTACAVGHNNNPRFNRHGHRYDHFMVANACMHCKDPVCMIGCPTSAIQRNRVEGQIIINDEMCIGCSSCANACPYENISMVEVRDSNGLVMRDEEAQTPILKATKCNLCIDQAGGPACERACPHDALERIDIQNLPQMISWMNR